MFSKLQRPYLQDLDFRDEKKTNNNNRRRIETYIKNKKKRRRKTWWHIQLVGVDDEHESHVSVALVTESYSILPSSSSNET